MKFINECFFGEIEVKKSGFYAGLFPLEKEEDVEHYLEECKKKYREARHHCYAYIFLEEREGIVQEHKKQSDDGEPAKTAGMPILQRMEGLKLKNALLVVSRIFGGTLLGTGGLSRAYSDAAKNALDKAIFLERIEGRELELQIPYTLLGKLEYSFTEQEIPILDKQFTENVVLKIRVKEEKYSDFEKQIREYGTQVVFLAIKKCRWYTR
ncbi:hypothetical protein HMPREF9625_00590 [Oribacterium parvum ACB1]|mgnify:FL=1|jgi:hypothetical protein|uniref:Impact N-terminal domain-containing protein n=1 Tax=Oribacterium parvum ACB1 TaxID=796943 RepID=G9WMK7_9FIRM|nr:YigZ family protein [Oribacterium parvum]EHL11760.1 hypothetical protein HMPREF9625_00590 [Oribacterium parvum ACB1]EJF13662.1 YigZ family protein [Oribacterium parvum ACB8]MBF1268278.1 YigZ family protein [Oribacterium parvum]